MNLKQQIPTGESAEKEYSFERKGTKRVYEAKGEGGRVR